MDIDYLLLLQDFRNSSGGLISSILLFITDTAVGFYPLAIICSIYWVFNREAGRRTLCFFLSARFINGFLKLCACVYRPWIRDSRVVPYGGAKTSATGYSFPSGHSTTATSLAGGIFVWLRKKNVVVVILAIVWATIVCFSRNYLGVHTPQDVLVGILSTVLTIFVMQKFEDWTDKNPKRDITFAVVIILLCVVTTVFYFLKSYPLDYGENGKLLCDPYKMINDSLISNAALTAYAIARYFERRGFDFQKNVPIKVRVIFAVICFIPIVLWELYICPQFKLINVYLYDVLKVSVIVFYILIVVPNIMRIYNKIK